MAPKILSLSQLAHCYTITHGKTLFIGLFLALPKKQNLQRKYFTKLAGFVSNIGNAKIYLHFSARKIETCHFSLLSARFVYVLSTYVRLGEDVFNKWGLRRWLRNQQGVFRRPVQNDPKTRRKSSNRRGPPQCQRQERAVQTKHQVLLKILSDRIRVIFHGLPRWL